MNRSGAAWALMIGLAIGAPSPAAAQETVRVPLDPPRPYSFETPESEILSPFTPTIDLTAIASGAWLVLTNIGNRPTAVSMRLGFAGPDEEALTTLPPYVAYVAPLAALAGRAGYVGQANEELVFVSDATTISAQILRVAADGTISNFPIAGCEALPTALRVFPHVFGTPDRHIAESEFVLANDDARTRPVAFVLMDAASGERIAEWRAALFPHWSVSVPASLIERSAPPHEHRTRYTALFEIDERDSERVRVTHRVRRSGTGGWRDVSAACQSRYTGPGYKWAVPCAACDAMERMLGFALERQGYRALGGHPFRLEDDTLRAIGIDAMGMAWVLRIDPATYEVLERRIPN
jgi:hypothetical protein